jgi:hypothetical protein
MVKINQIGVGPKSSGTIDGITYVTRKGVSLHVTTHAIHVNRSSPLLFSAYLCRAFPKGGAPVRLQNGVS